MPTTTNYGWTTPADTDLVKDGASAIRTLGTAIDTTVFNNAGAAIAKTIVDAKGDLIVASGSDAVARLAVGTNDYVLTADSAATNGIKWAAVPSGGMTLLSTTTLSGTTTTISGISGSYNDLMIIVKSAIWGTGVAELEIRPNSSTSLFSGAVIRNLNGTQAQLPQTDGKLGFYTNVLNTGGDNVLIATINQYANTSYYKPATLTGFCDTSGFGDAAITGGGALQTNSAITSIDVTTNNGYTFSSGTVYIYGVK